MEWTAVTTETVRNHMGVKMVAAYDKWIAAYPEKAGRLEEIVNSVRTEFRDAIAAKSKNWLHPDKTYLPESAVRHCENIVQYTLGMEMGVQLTVDGRTLLTRADMYLRQIVYGHNRFADENDSDETVPSYSVPSSTGRALGNLVALLVCVFLFAVGSARAAWIAEKNETTYVPVNYDITEQSLNGHLTGIDNALGWLSDTNSMYGDLVALPAVVYNLMDVLKSQALYGEYREEAGAWVATSQTNVIIFGTMAVNRLLVREDGATIHGNAEILDGGLDVSGDVSVGGGITMGGVRRDSWPPDVSGQYLPVTWEDDGTAVVSSNVAIAGLLGYGQESVNIAGGINANVEDAVPSRLRWLYSDDLTISSNGTFTIAGHVIRSFGDLTNEINSRVTSIEADYLTSTNLAVHTTDTNNPHGVTFAQVVDESCEDFGLYLDPENGGITQLCGWGKVISFEESLIQGEFDFWDRPSFDGVGLATTGELFAAIAPLATTGALGAVSGRVAAIEADYATSGDVAGAVAPLATTASVAAVSGRVDAIEADYVVSSDIAGFASTQDVASVERRVDRLEYPETCYLYWPTNYIVDNMDENDTIYVPTNFPTRKLSLVFNDSGITNLFIVLDTNWQPDHPVEIEITPVHVTSNVTTRATRVLGNGAQVLTYTAYNQYRRAVFTWDQAAGSYWGFSVVNMQYRMYWYGSSRIAYPTAWPSTVEAWEERYQDSTE